MADPFGFTAAVNPAPVVLTDGTPGDTIGNMLGDSQVALTVKSTALLVAPDEVTIWSTCVPAARPGSVNSAVVSDGSSAATVCADDVPGSMSTLEPVGIPVPVSVITDDWSPGTRQLGLTLEIAGGPAP